MMLRHVTPHVTPERLQVIDVTHVTPVTPLRTRSARVKFHRIKFSSRERACRHMRHMSHINYLTTFLPSHRGGIGVIWGNMEGGKREKREKTECKAIQGRLHADPPHTYIDALTSATESVTERYRGIPGAFSPGDLLPALNWLPVARLPITPSCRPAAVDRFFPPPAIAGNSDPGFRSFFVARVWFRQEMA